MNPSSERVAFEAWMRTKHYGSGGEWDAWQARAALSTPHQAIQDLIKARDTFGWGPEVDEKINALRSLSTQPQQAGWMPIETCPMDTMVVFGPTKRMSGPCIGMHHSRDGWVTETPSEWASIYPPKFWMPIDLPPVPGQEGGIGE